jgi:hypothetical protein
LEEVREELALDQDSKMTEVHFRDYGALDLRVPADSPVLKMDCYPHGMVPSVQLGTFPGQ